LLILSLYFNLMNIAKTASWFQSLKALSTPDNYEKPLYQSREQLTKA
jgi:hypothetical protein